MARVREGKKTVSLNLSESLIDALTEFSDEVGVSRSQLVEIMLNVCLNSGLARKAVTSVLTVSRKVSAESESSGFVVIGGDAS